MKFGIIATTAYLLTESTHAQLAAAARQKRRQRRDLKKVSHTKKMMHRGSKSDAGLAPKRRMLEEDTSFSREHRKVHTPFCAYFWVCTNLCIQ